MWTTILPIKLQSIKLLYCRYTTPATLHQLRLRPNDLCWKGCHQRADYIYCWWQCPIIHSFWSDICEIISEMTSCTLQNSPLTVLLHIWLDEEVPASQVYIISILLAQARLEISSKWKLNKPPNLKSWYDRIWKKFPTLQNCRLNITWRLIGFQYLALWQRKI